ncbi:hypothetical protein H5410_049226 [Solanum commersonii]|uniref:Helitron helicase-like domain-containing protein n=1 Tax=Solanum commersonii TaxID=4109 RepID=A0A9J5XNY0_SOLCO|nr:hypothetical protein H5410_049226 [Solanum commersonii]
MKNERNSCDIPHVEKILQSSETDMKAHKTNRCKRTKKIKEPAIADENPRKVRTHEVERRMYVMKEPADYNLSLSYLHVLKTVPECIYCAAKRLEHEPPAFCCASGYIKLATTEAPTELYEMFVASTLDAVEFRKNIRAYNSIFAFTSFGVNTDKELASARKGVHIQGQGQIYHDLPSLVPRDNNPITSNYTFDHNELTSRLSKVNEGILSDQIAKRSSNVRRETKGNVSCESTIVISYNYEKREGDRIGQRILLPSSLSGPTRYEKAIYGCNGFGATFWKAGSFYNNGVIPKAGTTTRIPPSHIKRRAQDQIGDQCKYHYPRPYNNKSIQANDGYPIYKRRMDGRIETVRGMNMTNQWVVPYSPYLLTRYNCHINVEYIYKGHDRCAVYVQSDDGENVIDEIQAFQDARWVSPPEALWRIYEFNLTEMQPAVINLQLHLPGKYSVFYWKNQNLQNVIAWNGVKQTMLTKYFRMCSIDIEAQAYLYREFPKYYVWNSKVKTWTKRKTRSVIGRIAIANPRERERYYERLLLNHVRGPLSFNDLLTVNGKQCQTFKEAAKERGLFATILVHCNPTDIRKLWDTYYEDMSEDFNRLYGNSHNTILQSTLSSINNCLQSMGKSIAIYDIPQLDQDFLEVGPSESREINEEMYARYLRRF